MSEVTGKTSIVINAPVQEVYAYLLDFTRPGAIEEAAGGVTIF